MPHAQYVEFWSRSCVRGRARRARRHT